MKIRMRLTAIVLALCLIMACAGASAANLGGGDDTEGVYKQGGFAGETTDTVYFIVNGTDVSNLYCVPSAGGRIELIESDEAISELVTVGSNVYYLRSVNGYWQLVCRTGSILSILHVFAAGADVSGLGYCDGLIYVINNGWLFCFDYETGASALVAEEQMSEYCIIGGKIYYISMEDERTYRRAFSDGSETVSVTGGCLYKMNTNGTHTELVLENGISDLRGYGEYLYYHNYMDNYFVASSNGSHWLDGKLYRLSIVTGKVSKAYDNYDWDYYPAAYGLMLYTQMSIDLYDVEKGSGIQLMMPELYTSVTAGSEFAYVYEHTAQSVTKLPLNGEVALRLGSGLPDNLTSTTIETIGAYVDTSDGGVNASIISGIVYDEATTETKPVEAASKIDKDSYIFAEASRRKLTTADLKKVACSLWAYGRNEIFARHGYTFANNVYAQYFAGRSWYKAGSFSSTQLNDYEWYNMEFIRKYEERYALQIEAEKQGKTSTEGMSAASIAAATKKSDSSYIFPTSNTKLLTEEDILAIDRSLWAFARNEIYARHGYQFKKAAYANYFSKKSWYKPGGFSSSQLSSVEWANMELIKQMEAKY
ncbi:MAG: YARHG domain-containing protein [Clostridia bacterium]|nr:YARHG domain-containing protein [Clostridia bacterium]